MVDSMVQFADRLGDLLDRDPNLIGATLIMFALLILATAGRLVGRALGKVPADRVASLITWWAIGGLIAAIIVTGPTGMAIILLVVTFFAIREYLDHLHGEKVAPILRVILYLAVIAQYGCLRWADATTVILALPLVAVLTLILTRIFLSPDDHRIQSTRSLITGGLLCIYLPSLVAILPGPAASASGAIGSVTTGICLIWLTESHDIAASL
ncbi:MAG: phosphatidate cytidylyltransferase, partial [Phycisphaeraceae bacterium]|nr:phosphatidate cytidylyltransferase [Phycisphaeraceae bacterium]